MTSSVYPSGWKIARILPIPKHGTDNSIDNMRHISILPTLSKVVEHLIKDQIVDLMESKKLLHDCQYGFRHGRSTNLLLMALTETIRDNWNKGKDNVLISIDITKAFDQMSHLLLISKLNRKFNFSRSACRLMWSYLSGRKQYVSVGGLDSSLLDVRSGVPQGSVIGPILFTLFLNDIVEFLSYSTCKLFIYADDLQLLWSSDRSFLDALEATINYDLSTLNVWMETNSLSVNPNKTKAIIFKCNRSGTIDLNLNICNTAIEMVNNLRCLGVIIDDKLSFEPHINNLCSKVCFTLRRLYHLNLYLPLSVKRTIAYALLMSQVNYCIEITSGCSATNVNKLKYIIHRIVRYVYGLPLRAHVSSHLRSFLNFSFSDYLKFRLLIYLYKIIKFHEPESISRLISFTNSERNPQILYALISNATYEHSFTIRAARFWNTLPITFRTFIGSLTTFKRMLYEYLTSASS